MERVEHARSNPRAEAAWGSCRRLRSGRDSTPTRRSRSGSSRNASAGWSPGSRPRLPGWAHSSSGTTVTTFSNEVFEHTLSSQLNDRGERLRNFFKLLLGDPPAAIQKAVDGDASNLERVCGG